MADPIDPSVIDRGDWGSWALILVGFCFAVLSELEPILEKARDSLADSARPDLSDQIDDLSAKVAFVRKKMIDGWEEMHG